jgi:class 3 adenylate cyclase
MSTVRCSICETESTAGKKFCGECGTALPQVCRECGNPVEDTQKFCDECGSPLGASRPGEGKAPADRAGSQIAGTVSVPSAVEVGTDQERRLVTILFADLAGSTPLAERMDAEEMYELIDGIHRRVEESIVRYGGHVARHLGDGLMVLFGAPTAHEDDAERAVLAGLEMQRTLAEVNAGHEDGNSELQMRVGITTGEVVAGAMSGIYDFIGDAPNVAARLQGEAPGGGVLVGEEAMRLASRRVRFGERQELRLKGKSQPVGAYAALGVREELGERWEGGERSSYAIPLVGREAELATLLTAWERAREGEGQLIAVVGEPGVGKSRLLAEAVDRMPSDGRVRILRGRCLSYGQDISLWLLAAIVRSLCSLREEDGMETVRQRIAGTVEASLAGSEPEDRAIAADVLGEVLGLAAGGSLVANAGPQIRRQSLTRSLRMVLGSLSEQQPVVIVLEDVHWLDAASQEILGELLPDVPGRQIPGASGAATWMERSLDTVGLDRKTSAAPARRRGRRGAHWGRA